MTPEPEWVDLGLPSGLLWAKCNIGSAAPHGVGLYFCWGDTKGYDIHTTHDFSQANYDESPAAAIDSDLNLSQDAARKILGYPWRMPTVEDCQELVDNCTGEWTSLNGVYGYLFTSNINGATIFFPSSGRFDGTTIKAPDGGCYYWTTVYESQTNAKFLHLSSSKVNPNDTYFRYLGFVIRAVRSA